MIIGVIGSGAIGPDLAYGFASALAGEPGSKVYLLDIQQAALDAGMARISGYVGKGVARGKLAPSAARAIADMLTPTTSIADLADCEYVMEAATERLDIKRQILRDIENTVGPECLIGFATSAIPRREIAVEALRPERCFVNHPFFPAWRSLPVEVVLSGSADHERRMLATLERLGKVPLITADVPCFAADDIFCNYCSEAARIVAEGVATPAQVDAIVNTAIGGGGPFNVLDGTRGNLLTAHCQELMAAAPTGSAWFDPPPILTERGNALWHDPANPSGSPSSEDPTHDDALAKVVLDRILAVLLARTYFVVDRDICAPTQTNWMTRTALGFRNGLLDVAEDLGADRVLQICRDYAADHPGFEIPDSIARKTPVAFYRNLTVDRIGARDTIDRIGARDTIDRIGIGADGDADSASASAGDIAVVRVFRPEVRNALNRRTMRELAEAFDALAADDSVRGVIVSSTDGALAGADLGELSRIGKPEDAQAICRLGHDVFARAERMAKPVVAAVDGPVLGGGAELSMACHARVVGPRLMMGQPEVNLGIIPGYGGTQRLPRVIGVDAAWDLLRTGRPIGAADACRLGWAHGEPTADVIGAAARLIRAHLAGDVKLRPVDPAPVRVPDTLPAVDIGHHSRAIDAILVDVIRAGLAKPLDDGLAVEADGFARCTQTVDLDIGLKNFLANGPRVPAMFLHE